jgi:hypothetical protein
MRNSIAILLSTAIVAVANLAFGQSQSTPPPATSTAADTQSRQPPPPSPPPPPPPETAVPATVQPGATPAPAAAAPEAPVTLSNAAAGAYDRRDALPSVNVYLPEGQASIRLRKLIKNVLFESQLDYKFVTGDISAFLRYKYYARNFTYKIAVFDTIEFPNIGATSTQEFQRTRGGLILAEFPRDYNRRYFWLLQDDRLTFGDTTFVDNRKNNVYTKVGIQFGTQFDERLNGIVGESRGRIVPVLTAFRDLGPQKFSLAAAVTESAAISTGDYKYTKLEAEALRRWDITGTSFVVTRAHVGTFLTKSIFEDRVAAGLPPIDDYTIPNYEMFPLGGREALKSIGASDNSAGTDEIHLTNEYFVPIFRNKDYRAWGMNWNTVYGIGYVGAGNVGFTTSEIGKVRNFTVDAGLGSEMSLTIRDFDVLVSVIYAHTVRTPTNITGSKVLLSIHTIR